MLNEYEYEEVFRGYQFVDDAKIVYVVTSTNHALNGGQRKVYFKSLDGTMYGEHSLEEFNVRFGQLRKKQAS